MSVALIVGSEEQLSRGLPWCKAIAENMRTRIDIVVVGSDHKVLREHARRRLAAELEQPLDQVSVAGIATDIEAILAHLKATGCSTLAMVYAEPLEELQRELFERTRQPAFWLQASGPPPTSAGRLFAAMGQTNLTTTTASEKLFGFAPAAVLSDPFEQADEPVGEVVERVTRQIETDATATGDLVLVGIGEPARENPIYAVGLKLLENQCAASVALIRDGDSLTDSLGSRVQDWFASIAPPMAREQRRELATDLEAGSKPNLEFLGLISAAAMLAAFGLLQNSAAVIIGAMLIAPLMTPIVGAGMALSLGNRPLFQSALLTVTIGFVGALTASTLFGLLVRLLHQVLGIDVVLEIDSTPEMWARCRPSPLDFCVGLVGGIAASYARTRRHLSSALAGAAIAAALVPPIATAGLQIAFGQWDRRPTGEMPVIGPLLLVSVNVLTIMVGSSFILWARGMRADRKLSVKAKWAPRMTALLLLLSLLALVFMVLP
jgi:uncharacterized hydrophobic protein (TIGR00271 family)